MGENKPLTLIPLQTPHDAKLPCIPGGPLTPHSLSLTNNSVTGGVAAVAQRRLEAFRALFRSVWELEGGARRTRRGGRVQLHRARPANNSTG